MNLNSRLNKNAQHYSSNVWQYFVSVKQNYIPSDYIKVFFIVFTINLLAYGYLFFDYIYTNHTFPNIYQQNWPSYRTFEGRWMADIIYMMFGGSGIPFLNLTLAVVFQIFNGILFAKVINKVDNISVLISAIIISLHPFILDYYGFGGDHLIFVLGDTFALLAVYINKYKLKGIVLSVILIILSLSCYQPKISLISTLFVIYILNNLASWNGKGDTILSLTREIGLSCLTILLGAFLYFIIYKIQVLFFYVPNSEHFLKRNYINNWNEILVATKLILANITQRLFFEDSFVFPYSRQFLGVIVLLSVTLIMFHICKISENIKLRYPAIAYTIFSIISLPIAAYASFIISKNSYWDSGRFFVVFPYITAFFLLIIYSYAKSTKSQLILLIVACLYAYNFVITNAKSTHFAYIRTIHEFQFVNRIVTRIENLISDKNTNKYQLVIFGDIPEVPQLIAKHKKSISSNIEKKGVIFYRQVEYLNYILGKNILHYPTKKSVYSARNYAEKHDVWPSKESVALVNNVIIVILQKPSKSTDVTMTVNG